MSLKLVPFFQIYCTYYCCIHVRLIIIQLRTLITRDDGAKLFIASNAMLLFLQDTRREYTASSWKNNFYICINETLTHVTRNITYSHSQSCVNFNVIKDYRVRNTRFNTHSSSLDRLLERLIFRASR